VRSIVSLAVVSATVFALFMLFRPVIGGIGGATVPDITGRAEPFVPDGATWLAPFGSLPAPKPVVVASTTKPSPADAAKMGIANLDPVERMILDLVNAERTKVQARDLTAEPTLQQIARGHSNDMLARGFFEHVNPDGQAPGDRVAVAHRQLIGDAGENIWSGSGIDAADPKKLAELIKSKLMASSGHRENILKPEYTHIGIGISVKDKEVRATQVFTVTRGFLDQPLPAQVATGDTLNLTIKPFAGGQQPSGYDFLMPNEGTTTGKDYQIGNGKVDIGPGVYKLRFHFPRAGRYSISDGPQIEVK